MLVDIDFRDKRPLYEQVSSKLAELILQGVLAPDEPLPSVRSLAVELSINPNTIQKAYSVLEQQGYTYSVSGRGSFAANVESMLPKKREELYKEADLLLKKAVILGITGNELAEYIRKSPERSY